MAIARVCDKCKKLILDGKFWNSDIVYHLDFGKPVEIGGQTLRINVQMFLDCGDHLDLCNSCAKKYLRKWVGKK